MCELGLTLFSVNSLILQAIGVEFTSLSITFRPRFTSLSTTFQPRFTSVSTTFRISFNQVSIEFRLSFDSLSRFLRRTLTTLWSFATTITGSGSGYPSGDGLLSVVLPRGVSISVIVSRELECAPAGG